MRYIENIVRHLVTTIMGAALIAAAVYVGIKLMSTWPATVANITMLTMFVGAGAYLLGAEGLITELSKFISNINGIFGLLKGKKPKH